MILSIDGYEANEGSRVGIGEYSFQLLSEMYNVLSHRLHNQTQVRVYLPSSPKQDLPVQSTFWKYRVRSPKKMWTFGALPASLYIEHPRAQVIFSPTHYIPRFIHIPRVMSIMDLSFLEFPDLFGKKDYYQLVQWTAYSVRHAVAILTISEFSKNAIIHEYKFPKEKIFVTYPGYTMNKIVSKHPVDVREKYKINSPYILTVGTLQPRKNFEKLIEAFSLLCQKKEFNDIQLVIVGKKGWLYESILSAPKRYSVEHNVMFLDFVPDNDLSELYKQAECFVLPSLYEGFGLPVLEAMANNCPVVISDVSSLPEIAETAAIYVDPKSTKSIQSGLEQSLTEKNTDKGKRRVAVGKKRVELFTWENAAKKTLEILEKVGKGEIT